MAANYNTTPRNRAAVIAGYAGIAATLAAVVALDGTVERMPLVGSWDCSTPDGSNYVLNLDPMGRLEALGDGVSPYGRYFVIHDRVVLSYMYSPASRVFSRNGNRLRLGADNCLSR